MKTEAIRDCIDRCLALTATQDRIYRGVVDRSVAAARAELAALEADNAAMREALKEGIKVTISVPAIKETFTYLSDSEYELARELVRQGKVESHLARSCPCKYAGTMTWDEEGNLVWIAALTPDSGKVLVNTPTLMLLRDTIQGLLDVQNGCPLPKYQEMFDAANVQADEMLGWLAALLKDRP